MNELIPLVKKFDKIKQTYPLVIILIKLGESYFSFRDDALKVAVVTGSSLDKTSCEGSEIPVCDFAFQFFDQFLPLLVKSGKQVGICEMPEIPKTVVPESYNRLNENRKVTYKDYITFLDENAPEWESDEWIIGGVLQTYYRAGGAYGNALRKHDPIGFNVGFKEYERKFNTKL